ncbi:MAG: GNAT family N-acetyltransferase [Caldithrix sp.]|nr:GNAT family N-acetyltransferase [Caldithrix sp.]
MTDSEIQIKGGTADSIIRDVQYLHKTIWGLDDLEMIPSHMYIATDHCGGQMLCAYMDQQPVGFVYGFPGIDEKNKAYFYSHNLGVLKEYRNRGIAFLLKVELRSRLLRSGFKTVKWTYEPLDSKNAYAYIRKLGCVSNTYFKNYYGEMRDAINKELPSDRLLMEWPIAGDHVQNILDQKRAKLTLADVDASRLLNATQPGARGYARPVDRPVHIEKLVQKNQLPLYLEIPANHAELKDASFRLALDWRMHVREKLTRCFAQNIYITDVIYEQDRFFYVLDRFKE